MPVVGAAEQHEAPAALAAAFSSVVQHGSPGATGFAGVQHADDSAGAGVQQETARCHGSLVISLAAATHLALNLGVGVQVLLRSR